MTISDYLKRLKQGEKDILNPMLLQQRAEALFPGVDFTLKVEGSTLKTTGLTEEQNRQLLDEIIKLSGL